VERGSEAVGDAALDLGLDAERVHRLPAVDHADHPVHADAAVGLDRDLRDLGDDAEERAVDGEPEAAARRWLAPAGPLRGELEYLPMTGRFLEQPQPVSEAFPSRWTVQAPHWDIPHPNLVPV